MTRRPHLKSVCGAPERIRTSDPQIRNLVLYPTELRAQRSLILADLGDAASIANVTRNQAQVEI